MTTAQETKHMQKSIAILAMLFAHQTWALTTECPPTTNHKLATDETIFFYRFTKNAKQYILPLAQLRNNKFSDASFIAMPAHMTLYDLKQNKTIAIDFTQQKNNTGDCVSIGTPHDKHNKLNNTLYATQPLAKEFHFSVKSTEKKDIPINTNDLIAISSFMNEVQVWSKKHYRYDTGIALDIWNQTKKSLTPVTENCALCAD